MWCLIGDVAGTKPLAPNVITPDDLPAGALIHGHRPAGSIRWLLSARFCWSLSIVALLLNMATVGIAVADGDLFMILCVSGLLAETLICALVASHRPGHPMGVLLCSYVFTAAAALWAFAYARAAVVHFPGVLPFGRQVLWATGWDFAPVFALAALILPLVFPDGRLLSRRWRPALCAAVVFVVLALAGGFAPGSTGGWFSNRPTPYALHGPLFGVIVDLAYVWFLAVLMAAAASVA